MVHRKYGLFCFAWMTVQATLLPLQAQVSEFEKRFPWFAQETRPASFPEIIVGSSWLAQRIEGSGTVPLDVRSRALYEDGHLPGAIHLEVPSNPSEGGGLLDVLAREGVQRQQTLVLYGDDQDRQTIGKAYLALAGIGWESIKVLAESYNEWVRSELPVETASKERLMVSGKALRARSVDFPFITLEELRASFGRAGFEILDLRDSGGWGEDYAAPPLYSAGHVPHSLPFDVRTLLPPTGWPDPIEARERFAVLGPRSSERVDLSATFLLYGTAAEDPQLGLTFLVLRMLGISARVFPSGYSAWSVDPQAPVVHIVSAEELRSLLARERKPDAGRSSKKPVLFDLREDWDFEEGHIPGARSLPERVFAEEFEKIVRRSSPTAESSGLPLVFYCYGRECTRSRNCATLAAQKGFKHLLWFREGMAGWAEINGPLEPAPSSQETTGKGSPPSR